MEEPVKGQIRGRASFLHWRKDGSPLALQQHHDESGRLRVAGVAPHEVNICRPLVESLSCFERYSRLAFQLHNDLAFEHVDERMGIMSMGHVLSARRIRHLNYATLLARVVREIDREQLLHICSFGRNGCEYQECHQVTAEVQARFLHMVPLSASYSERAIAKFDDARLSRSVCTSAQGSVSQLAQRVKSVGNTSDAALGSCL